MHADNEHLGEVPVRVHVLHYLQMSNVGGYAYRLICYYKLTMLY